MTRNLQRYLEHMVVEAKLGRISRAKYDNTITMITEKLDSFQAMIRKLPPGPSRATTLHTLHQGMVKKNREKNQKDWSDISCKKGCWGCCMQRVDATADEIDLLAEAGDFRRGHDRPRKARAKPRSPTTRRAWWNRPNEEKTCVFLGEDKACISKRPMACRGWIVKTPAEHCYTPELSKVAAVVILEHEIFASGRV